MTVPSPSRPVRLLAAGGTISMQGEHAVPRLDAAALIAAIPELRRYELAAETVFAKPGSQLTLDDALHLARRAREAAARGEGVVITTGTDTLEELAMLCALVHEGEAPIVLTGANRTAAAPGADGPANLLDAVATAAAPDTGHLHAVVVFGGEIHAADTVRKTDSTGPSAFGSPMAGPIGRVVEERIRLHADPTPPPTIDPRTLDHRVPIITSALGDSADLVEAAADFADGVIVVAFGAGHLSPPVLRATAAAAERMPVVVTVRPERGSMMHATYGFEGAERDLRASGAIAAPFLSAPAARIALLCCLGATLDSAATAAVFAPYDA